MCGRFTQQRPTSELADIFGAEDLVAAPGGRFNIAPTDEAAVVVAREERRAVTAFRWGFIPHWADDARIGNRMINARAETLATSGAFREALRRRRCLVPVDAFYEWRVEGQGPRGRPLKQPFRIARGDGRPLGLAGLWSGWHDPDTDRVVRTFTIVTTAPNALMATIHDRMPAIVPAEAWDRWLDPQPAEPSELLALLGAAADGDLVAYPVSRRVNDVRNDDAGLAEPIGPALEPDSEANPEPPVATD
jgi:putative SOS response-associated peptidase YedK